MMDKLTIDHHLFNFAFENRLQRSYGAMMNRLLEQQAQLADQLVNEQLLQALVKDFVRIERELAEAHRQVVALSRTDALTNLANRRWFDESLHSEWSRAVRASGTLGLLLLDIDCFKLYNDNYGHPAGDDCLRQVARTIQGVLLRPPDLVARYGGEEIVCLLPGTGLAGIKKVGEEILAAIRTLALPHAFSKVPDAIVTVSIGGSACLPRNDLEAAALLKQADEMLYHSKENGRNRLTVAQEML
ncbi:GGDEF domain-containing protein [Candidatus Magnetaquicoccus inordinatus]|uniref:GGDEF domain-containing protein n=1 Tax=Candidatus Magnetaquicoccus inordinatus TaxID=2496818 RepID=UPI001D0E06A1|nr:GGDEF domain-containing protein [Candidatus Magnetaquicoccus inordinatus]